MVCFLHDFAPLPPRLSNPKPMTLETKTIGFGNPLFRRKKAQTQSISFSAVYKLSRESKIYSLKTIKLKEAPSREGICKKLFGRAFPDDIAVVYKALNAVPEVPNAEEWQAAVPEDAH